MGQTNAVCVIQSSCSVQLTFLLVAVVTHCPSPPTPCCRGSDFEALLAGELGSQEGGEGEQD